MSYAVGDIISIKPSARENYDIPNAIKRGDVLLVVGTEHTNNGASDERYYSSLSVEIPPLRSWDNLKVIRLAGTHGDISEAEGTYRDGRMRSLTVYNLDMDPSLATEDYLERKGHVEGSPFKGLEQYQQTGIAAQR